MATADPSSVDPAFRAAARAARRLLVPVRSEVIELLQTLVRIDSTAVPPHGKEAQAQQALGRILRAARVETRLYDTSFLSRCDHPAVRRDREYRGRPNLVARLPGQGPGRSLLLSGHIDTVPPGPGRWRRDPFSGTISRGRLHGRGAFDMKGGLAAQFGVLLALKRAKVRLAGDLVAESVVDEEWAGGGGTLAARLRGITAQACVIGEGTGLSVVRATRGGLFVEILARAGDPAAYFSKDEVVSPAVPIGRLLGWVDEWTCQRRRIGRGEAYRGFADPAPVQVLALEANRFDPGTPWSVPLEARLRLYFQFLPHEDQDAGMRAIEDSFRSFCAGDPFFSVHPPAWRRIVDPPLYGHELPADHPWTSCLAGAAAAVLRRPVPVSAAEYPCDASLIQRGFGIPVLLFGPSGSGAHNLDEQVVLSSVVRTAECLLTAALCWCG